MTRHYQGHAAPRGAGVAFALALMMTLAVAMTPGGRATASTATDRTRVRPFSEVQASDIRFARDTSDPTRGIFRVTTTEPMICAIVWGTDLSFGRFNNSLSMNGTGITEHDVLLPDAKPGVQYSYVVQGSTADGTLYRSAIRSFRLPAGAAITTPPSVRGLHNVAPEGRVVESSSEFSEAFRATNAIDDETATEWATKGDGDGGFITLELAAPTDIAAVEFLTRSMADGSAITSRYTLSIDGGPKLGPFPAGTVARPRPTSVGRPGQRLRFQVVQSTGGNVGAVEIRVYQKA